MMKKGQEEIVGFVVVMVLVSVVLLVVLGLSFSPSSSISSKNIEQFLQSSLEYTTDCALRYVPDYARVKDLVNECKQNSLCIDSRNACDVLNDTMKGLISEGLQIGPERPFVGYTLNIYNSLNQTQDLSPETILYAQEGNCNGTSRRGASIVLPAEEGLNYVVLNVCVTA